jgi:hypothetical protein
MRRRRRIKIMIIIIMMVIMMRCWPCRRYENVRLLLEMGCDAAAINFNGHTALDEARTHNTITVAAEVFRVGSPSLSPLVDPGASADPRMYVCRMPSGIWR